MGVGGTLDWGIIGILLIVTVLLFLGKGDFIFAGMKSTGKPIDQIYDMPRLKRTTAYITGVLGIVQLVITLFGAKLNFLLYIYIPVVIAILIVGNIVLKKCKK